MECSSNRAMASSMASSMAPISPGVTTPLVITLLSLGFLAAFEQQTATFMMLLAVIVAQVFFSYIGLKAIVISFLVGFLSDLSLNLYFRGDRAVGPRGRNLRAYFDRSGDFQAACFAGALTVIMTGATVALSTSLDLQTTPSYDKVGTARDVALICCMGFVVGFVLGIPAQYTIAMRNLLPFYNSTSGLLENRTWDGASQAWVMLLVQLVVPFL